MRLSISNLSRNAVLVLLALAVVFAADARAVTIDWTTVGNPHNLSDTTGRGSVATSYRIDKYEVTNQQYVDFLNAVDPNGSNTLGLFNTSMNIPSFIAISFDPLAGAGHQYSVVSGRGSQPVTYVTLYDTLRFANWLNNGQGSASTETGAYNLTGGTPTPSNANSIVRTLNASVFIPNVNEWYKAAYYDPRTTAQGGPPSDSHYWLYPTSSNTAPTATGPTASPNSANYNGVVSNTFVDIGSYPSSASPYGTFDQGGNAFELNESVLNFVGMYCGYSGVPASWMISSFQIPITSSTWDSAVGFRVASAVPEPSSLALAALGFIGLCCLRRR